MARFDKLLHTTWGSLLQRLSPIEHSDSTINFLSPILHVVATAEQYVFR